MEFIEELDKQLGLVAQEARRARVPRLTEILRVRCTQQDMLDLTALVLLSSWIDAPISSAIRAVLRAAVVTGLGDDWRTTGIDRRSDGAYIVHGYRAMQPFDYVVLPPDEADAPRPVVVTITPSDDSETPKAV